MYPSVVTRTSRDNEACERSLDFVHEEQRDEPQSYQCGHVAEKARRTECDRRDQQIERRKGHKCNPNVRKNKYHYFSIPFFL